MQHGSGSTLENICLHRDKCSGLIRNVISPSIKNELVAELKDKQFAIIIDESTDIAIHKNLCLLVRFFSDKRKCVVTEFVALLTIQETNAENIFSLIEGEIAK